jgi:GxxExxY protein
VVDAALHVHQALGPGLLESVYEIVLAFELRRPGASRRMPSPDRRRLREPPDPRRVRADLIVEGCVLVELKSVERTAPAHRKQALTYSASRTSAWGCCSTSAPR